MPMQITIPMNNVFHLNEGNYRGQLQTLSVIPPRKKTGPGEGIRLLFRMNIPSIKREIPMAGRSFVLNLRSKSDLRQFLDDWLGADFFESNAGSAFDLETLIGREADLTLAHYHQVGYEKPMTYIQSASPPGTLKLNEEPAIWKD